ncbi:MAG: TetR/AcrR family transcriptional regulator [Betaproteobacteria bacterium]|nr:MAG: TetR/AcrR family transcriptional regulator [Betaproteobacteria bacterium]
MARPSADQKTRELRRDALLDAAMKLWMAHPERIVSVAEVAQAAGVAKGTLYLYFTSKENLLLAAHERHVAGFFSALMARASQAESMDVDDMLALTRAHIVEVPPFLPLAMLVAGLLHNGATPEAAAAFEQRMAERLRLAGEALCRHFPLPDAGASVRLLMQSYGLILGLWQLLGKGPCACVESAVADLLHPDYDTELEAALRALWQGALQNKDEFHA